MNKFLLRATCVLAVGAVSCWADEIVLDPLHGYCEGTAQCIDNGTNSPTTNNPPTDFGFTISPGPGTGTLFFDFLIPDNALNASSEILALTGPLPGTPKLVSLTPWSTGNLDAYLGISASPTNPIGAYLPSTKVVDPGATGFFVYQVGGFPDVTLQDPSNPNVWPLENFAAGDSALPIGSYIVGFFDKGTTHGKSQGSSDLIATANSGAIFVDAAAPLDHDPTTTPEPSSLILFGSASLGVAFFLRRKARKRA